MGVGENQYTQSPGSIDVMVENVVKVKHNVSLYYFQCVVKQ